MVFLQIQLSQCFSDLQTAIRCLTFSQSGTM